VRLPSVRIGPAPSRFIPATASTASPPMSWVLAQANGGCSVDENTTFGVAASSSTAAASSASSVSASAANPDISR
jgi:hypothetical protein